MELLEFKKKMFELCGVSEISQIRDVLYNAALSQDVDIFDGYNSIVDGTKDWLQALWQYYEADRTEKKQDYTPKSLCRLVAKLAGDCKSVYDCCGGSGALTIEMLKNGNIENVFIEELGEKVIPFLLFNLCFHNASGYVANGDVLTREQFQFYKLTKGEKYSRCEVVDHADPTVSDVSISNPIARFNEWKN